ncbi:MAG: hypothetical protein HY925_04755 [Elusimicrobia bacterium]|nr:hypothetical protein [Elusimicrobiota bacterium]
MTRKIELYGRLRDAGAGEALELDLAAGLDAAAVLSAVAQALGSKEPLAGAVLATEAEVLSASDPVPESGRLAVLPPVCGG